MLFYFSYFFCLYINVTCPPVFIKPIPPCTEQVCAGHHWRVCIFRALGTSGKLMYCVLKSITQNVVQDVTTDDAEDTQLLQQRVNNQYTTNLQQQS